MATIPENENLRWGFTIPPYIAFAQESLKTGLEAQRLSLFQSGLADLYKKISALGSSNQGFLIRDGAVYSEKKLTEAIELARELIPWRKGPFCFGDFYLDAEWRSGLKWERLTPYLPNLYGRTVADVGCNNGYYLYRIAESGAKNILGLDPTLKYYLQYLLVAAHTGKVADFLPLGYEALWHMPSVFDVIFLMGVNYHDPEPLEMLHACRHALREGGALLCESVVIPTEADLEIFPAGKYAGIGGVYAIPSATALMRQIKFAGFSAVRLLYSAPLLISEQRRSEFSPQPSLADYLTKDGLTCEGYPAPHRAAILAYQ